MGAAMSHIVKCNMVWGFVYDYKDKAGPTEMEGMCVWEEGIRKGGGSAKGMSL